MASANALVYLVPAGLSTAAVGTAFAGYRAMSIDWSKAAREFLTGPGRTSRILLMLFVLLNWKSMPLMWSFRVIYSFVYHTLRRRQSLPSRALFHYSITTSRNNLMDSDYNLHKSNSTYFADLDSARSHHVTHLLGPALPRVTNNARYKLVRDGQGSVVRGGFRIGLGAVFGSFRREVGILAPYEVWTRVLAWDRKWLYLVSHFVVAGKVRPTDWDGVRAGPTRSKVVRTGEKEDGVVDFSKHVYATLVSKYVFKLGRFTVHPAIVLRENGLLPERPGDGWRGGEDGVGVADDDDDDDDDLGGDNDEQGEWDWRRIERERRKGMRLAGHFAALDATNSIFDGAEDGCLGKFPVG